MLKPENRSQLMEHFGAKQKNTVWSWCAVNEETKSVYLSVWDDYRNTHKDISKTHYLLQEQDWGLNEETGSLSAARNDHDENLAKVFDRGYQAYGYFVSARDKNELPREIEKTKTSFVFSLQLERLDNGDIIGYPLDRIEVN